MNLSSSKLNSYGIVLLVGLLIGSNLPLIKNAKASSTTLSGSCGFVMSPQRFGWTPSVGNTYDSITYGVIDFDNKTLSTGQGHALVNAGDAEPTYSETAFTASFVPHALTVSNAWKLSLVNSSKVETGDSINVISTNSGNTFLIADMHAGGTGVCQKL